MDYLLLDPKSHRSKFYEETEHDWLQVGLDSLRNSLSKADEPLLEIVKHLHEETKNLLKHEISTTERLTAHSHIRGLDLDDNFEPKKISQGMVGQVEARKDAGIVLKMIKEGKFSGRVIMIGGPPGTGKTAIAMGIAKSLGEQTPFTILSGSEDLRKMELYEVLTSNYRKTIGK